MDEPNGSATCTLLSGTGYTVGSTNTDTITIVDDDPTIASLVATSDTTFTEQRASDTAAVTMRLSRRLYVGEQLAVPIDYIGAEGIDAHDESDQDYTLSVSGNGATGANLTSDIFYVQFTGHDTDIVQEATVTLTPTNNGDADTDDGFLTLGISAVTDDWTDSSFTNVGGGGERHGTERSVRLTYRDDDLTLTLSIPDATAVEEVSAGDDAEVRLALSRALVSGETVAVPLGFAGGVHGTDFSLLAPSPPPAGVSLSGSTVTFTGPSASAVTLTLRAVEDLDDTDDTVAVSLGTVTSTGVTVASTRSGNGEIRLLETVPYTASPGPPLVIVDSIVPVHGSCAGRECETTEVPAGNDIIINARLVRPALEKGVGFIPVAATRQIAVNAYLQPGVHAHQWLTPLTFAVGEKSKTALLRISPSTLVESDVRRMLMFSGPVGSWDDGNPPPFGVVTNDPYWITIKDGPDGTAGNLAPTVTVDEWLEQKRDGGVPEGQPAHFVVRSASAAQGPFTVRLKVEETAGDCVAAADERVHTVSFAPQVGSVAFSVPTVDDGNAERDCTVKASLARADGTVPAAGTTTQVLTNGRFGYTIDKTDDARLGGVRTHKADAAATVRDDDSVARKVSFVTNSQQVKESAAGTVDLAVAVDPAPSAGFDLNFSLSGSATRGSDYTVPATVAVAPGATRAAIPVTIVDDSVEDSGEWVTVKLLASGGYQPFSPVRASIKILNHEPGDGAPDWTDHRTVVDHLIEARDNPSNAAVKGNPAHVRKWNRVLAAVGHASGEEAMPASEIHANAANWPDSPFWAASVYLNSVDAQDGQDQDQPRQQEPEVTVTADAASVTEGGDAVFTFTASPAPAADLAVGVTVGSDGDWGVTAGDRTVTIPTSGSATLTLATAGDDADEPDGSLTVTVNDGDGYAVGDPASGTVAVGDDDEPPPGDESAEPDWTDHRTVVDYLIEARDNPGNEDVKGNPAHIRKWNRVLEAVGHDTGTGLSPMPASEIHANAAKWPDSPFRAASAYLKSLEQPQQEPEVTVTADAASVTEGGDAVFTFTASPAPSADLAVDVTVVADGDYGIAAGTRTVTIPASGSAKLTLATTDDAADEPDGSLTVTVNDGDGYTVGSSASGTVAVRDNDDAVLPVVTLAAGSAVTEGGDAVFTFTASPAPAADLAVDVTVGTDGDYGITAGTRTVTMPTSGSAKLTLATTDDAADEPDGSVTVTVADGQGYTVGSSASGTVAVRDNDDAVLPEVTLAAGSAVTEGGDAVFTLTASPAPAADLPVSVTVASDGDWGVSAGGRTVTIPASGSAKLTLATADDETDEPDGSVSVTVNDGDGYAAGDPASGTVAVRDDDEPPPTVSVDDAEVAESGDGDSVLMTFTARLSRPAPGTVTVRAATRDSSPASAAARDDYHPFDGKAVRFRPGQVERSVHVLVYDDSHDEGEETFELALSDAEGAAVGDGVAVGTIVNADPMPAAWLARFGRAVADQALDGIAARVESRGESERAPGFRGAFAGVSIGGAGLGAGACLQDAGELDSMDAGEPDLTDGVAAPAEGRGGAAADGPCAAGRPGLLAFGAPPAGGVPGAGQAGSALFGANPMGSGHGGAPAPQPGGVPGGAAGGGLAQLLLGSRFTYTGGEDASGGVIGFWGRGTQTRFDGADGDLDLDGDVTTAMLGADYARGDWLAGVALTQSFGRGGYRGPAPAGDLLADGGTSIAGSATDGAIETSLTAAVPYAAWRPSERLNVWGAAGFGSGDLTLAPEGAGSVSADIGWTMAAAGLKGELFSFGGGTTLSLVSDALWAGTRSDRADGLAATESGVSRLRLGVEGGRRFELPGGGSLTPKLEIGARHDGGDAETGFGVEVGGGIAWTDPRFGLRLDLEGRTLLAHDDGAMRDRGFSASLAWDPRPDSARGLSLALRQDAGGPSGGGLDALFADGPAAGRRAGHVGQGGSAPGRWTMEAGYGLPAFGGRFTGTPHLGYGASAQGRGLSVGWRLAPEARPGAPDLSLGLLATRREGAARAPEHVIGLEFRAAW